METPGKEGVIGLQELKKFMQRVNFKIPTNLLKEKFSKYDIGNTGDIGFDDFCSVLQELNFPRQLFRDVFNNFSVDSKRVTITEFQQFLEQEQVRYPQCLDLMINDQIRIQMMKVDIKLVYDICRMKTLKVTIQKKSSQKKCVTSCKIRHVTFKNRTLPSPNSSIGFSLEKIKSLMLFRY